MSLSSAHEDFFTNYYSTHIRSLHSISNFFVPNSVLSLAREQQDPLCITSDYDQAILDFHKRKTVRILIVTYSTLQINDVTSYLVIGQIKFDDGTMERFVENMHVNDQGLIVGSVVMMLDEEIYYGKSEFLNKVVSNPQLSLLIKNGAKLTYKAVIDNFGRYGKIVAFEKRNGDSLLEYESSDALNCVREVYDVLKEKGIHVVFDYAVDV